MSTDNVVLSFHDSLLRESDLKLLNGPHWLNDTLISFYFEYLENVRYKNNSALLFVSPEVTQCVKISSVSDIPVFLDPLKAPQKDFIFFALNDNQNIYSSGGSHWSLLIFSKTEKTLFHLDSHKGTNYNQAKDFGSKLLQYLNLSTQGHFVEPETLQQSNFYDCGVHLLCNVDLISDYVTRNYTIIGCGTVNHLIIQNKRNELVQLIESLTKITNC